ncbi:zinc finger protein rotund-like isoform X6 [Biomphalaria glabrata]|uniref:Zinc finger protein rotund-like isoform X6 n=1 Tax=Biomphalaria glabrata TaxID=6526 RepID=A0A9W2YNK8_BIOGL|nr:zinc finger protein rotund-like isoform X6 [Biomphalaria glabrata]
MYCNDICSAVWTSHPDTPWKNCEWGTGMVDRTPRNDFAFWTNAQQGGASDMTTPGAAASAAEPHQPSRCQWLNDQESHFHHARRFQTSPLSYFKWTKGDNPHDHGLGLGGHDGLHHGLSVNDHIQRNSSGGGAGGGGNGGSIGGGGGGGGGINYARTTSTGSMSGPPTPTNGPGGPNTPLVVPQPVKPPSRTGTKTYQCKICDQVFTTKSDMLIHCQQIHKQDPKPYKCPTCSKSFANSSYLSQHARIHSGLKPYKCEICERKFTQLSHLQQHIRTHTGEKPYKCMHPDCPLKFSQLSHLKQHFRSHTGEKPYKCLFMDCPLKFAQLSHMKQHYRSHTGEKPYKCMHQDCPLKFAQLSHMKQHYRSHTGEKPYQCMYQGCGKAFSQLSNLQSHSRSHMTDKPFRCNSCYKCYADEQSLREHIPKHSDTKHLKTHICHICGKSYTQETYLTRHMTKHSQENVPKIMTRPIKQEPMDLVDRDFIGARLPDRSTPSDLSMNPGGATSCSKGSAPSSAFMPLSPFAANTVSSSSGPGYHYSPGLSHNSLSSPLPHISSMASPRYFPYDPIAFGRKSDGQERNLNMAGVPRESMIANSLLSLQHIKNYASQQMPSFTPTPGAGSRLA